MSLADAPLRLFALIVSAASALFASALQAPQEPSLEFGKVAVVHSAVLNEDRRLNGVLPAGYDAGTQKYPVIYLLDGGNACDVAAHQPVQRDAFPE